MRIYGEKLRLVRLAMRWPQGGLAEVLGLPQTHLSQMETGARPVPERVANQVSFITGYAPSFFSAPIRSDVPRGSELWYRKSKNKYRKTEAAQAYCQLVFDTFEALATGLRPIRCRLSSLSDCAPDEAADHVRNALGLRSGIPISNLTLLAESAGIRIIGIERPTLEPYVSEPLPMAGEVEEEDEFEAFSFWTTSRLPVVFIRSDLPADRYQWALAHELIHLVMHSSFHGEIRQAERDAQIGTGHLLMPEEAFRDTFPIDGKSVRAFIDLASIWNVSLESVIHRSFELSLIPERTRNYYLAHVRNGAGSQVRVLIQKPRFYRQMCELLFGKPLKVSDVAARTGASKRFIESVLVAHSGLPQDLELTSSKSTTSGTAQSLL